MSYLQRSAIIVLLLGLAACGQVNLLGTERTGRAEITGLDDALETAAVISTIDYERPRLLIRGSADPSFRAVVPKDEETAALIDSVGLASDGALYQFRVRTNSDDWMFWSSARYSVGGGVESLSMERLGSDVSCSGRTCDHYEIMAATVSRSVVESMASADTTVTVRLSSRRGDRDFGVEPNEARVFLTAVDSVRARVGIVN